jgi:hypothetical protein
MDKNLVILSLVVLIGLAWAAPSWKNEENVEEIPHLFEGDMILRAHNKNGLIGSQWLWPDATLIYTLDNKFCKTVRKCLWYRNGTGCT